MPTHGTLPGWIFKHKAVYEEQHHAIKVSGGSMLVPNVPRAVANFATHRLYLEDMRWELVGQREQHREFRFTCRDRSLKPGTPAASAHSPKTVAYTALSNEEVGAQSCVLSVNGVHVVVDAHRRQRHIKGALPPEIVEQMLGEITQSLNEATGSKWLPWEITKTDEDI